MQSLLDERQSLTGRLQLDPYSFDLHARRAAVYHALAYPDLAAGDAYKALLLIDEVVDECGECHEEALGSFRDFASSSGILAGGEDAEEDAAASSSGWLDNRLSEITLQLAQYLCECGCLKSAYEYVQRAARNAAVNAAAVKLRETILQRVKHHYEAKNRVWSEDGFSLEDFPDQGFVRREVYPWNTHEADRCSAAALETLNSELRRVAPKLEVKVTELPLLSATSDQNPNAELSLVKQLGVFARQDLAPGEEILRERSLLTATSQLHEPLCDACNTVLPTLDSLSAASKADNISSPQNEPEETPQPPVPCPDCDDILFCSTNCLALAQQSYHPATCGADIDNLLKDVPPTEASNALYTLLLLRALAMAQTQAISPLDLPEVKYIWGDFNPAPNTTTTPPTTTHSLRTLPFSFPTNILTPIHFLTQTLFPHALNIFTAPHALAEPWVHNTLLAKFRATASARMTPRPVVRGGPNGAVAVIAGLPDAAVVHPLWCLANHSCAPNVGWRWERERGGAVRFWVRRERVRWRRGKEVEVEMEGGGEGQRDEAEEGGALGIRAGEEIMSHYVDIDLPVKERREWGVGALGGLCRCPRCEWEQGG